jgi:hypothetical protein
MNQTEMVMRRRTVSAFIDADKFSLVVTRALPPVKTEAGGYAPNVQPPTVLPPQRARVVLNRRRYTAGIVNSEAGDIPHTDYLLIGMHTLDLQNEDEFDYRTDHYKVIGIYEARIESTLAAIELLGPRNRNAVLD